MHLACWERRRGGAFKIGTGTDVIWGSTIVLCQRNIQIWFNKTFFVLLTDPSLRCTAGLFSCRPTSLTRLFRTRKNQPSYITSRMKIHRDLAPIEFPFSFFFKEMTAALPEVAVNDLSGITDLAAFCAWEPQCDRGNWSAMQGNCGIVGISKGRDDFMELIWFRFFLCVFFACSLSGCRKCGVWWKDRQRQRQQLMRASLFSGKRIWMYSKASWPQRFCTYLYHIYDLYSRYRVFLWSKSWWLVLLDHATRLQLLGWQI